MTVLFRLPVTLSLLLIALEAFPQLNLQQIGHLPYTPLTLAGCKAHVDSTGNEWALVGTSAGLSIVDLGDPTQPVERFAVPGLPNNWREVRTWKGFAYVGSEAQGSGITIVDLRELPDTIQWKVWFGDGAYDSLLQRSHTVQAVDGRLYVFGGGDITGGCTISTLDDPWNPHIIGKYASNYVHDGFIRGDTLWTSEIYSGQFGVVDMSNLPNLQLLTTQPTPGKFNHNTELSADGNILFAADEVPYAPLASFDVSDLDNITLLDTYLASQQPAGEVHNVRVKGDFLVNPSYRGQLTIVDATRPDNLIETGWALLGTSLVWDADPYLPSGIVFATAKNEGLFVFQPTYQHACWLEGTVRDSITGQPLVNAKVFVLNTPNADTSRADGAYKTGAALPGNYNLQVFRQGYQTKTVSGVSLETGLVTTLDIELVPEIVGVKVPHLEQITRISPAPFRDYFNIELLPGNGLVDASAVLRDVSGKILAEQALVTGVNRIDASLHWPAGNYLLSLRSVGREVYTTQLIKQ